MDQRWLFLNKEFLDDYTRNEIDWENFLHTMPGSESVEVYKKRFTHLQDPIAYSYGAMSIWPQIPLYGTLIIPLHPLAETADRFKPGFKPFVVQHGFEPADVQQLVDFSRNTGKVAFVLAKQAKEYSGLDFLDPIFLELKPPRMHLFIKPSPQQAKRFKYCEVEFDTLGKIRYYNELRKVSILREANELGPGGYNVEQIFASNTRIYTMLDFFGYSDLTKLIAEALTEDPYRASNLLHVYERLIVNPRSQLMKGIHNVNVGALADPLWPFGKPSVEDSSNLPYSYEIGKFLMNKLAPYPMGFDACRVICDRYKHEDLYGVMSALQQAVETEDYPVISAESKQLSRILDNVWDDTKKIESRKNMISGGIPIGIAALGGVAAGIPGAAVGLLAALGVALADKFVDIKKDSISEQIAKATTPNYLVNIFDFKRRYDVKK